MRLNVVTAILVICTPIVANADMTKLQFCKIEADHAEAIMKFRQQGGDVIEMLEGTEKNGKYSEIFVGALEVPIFKTEQEKEAAVKAYRDKQMAYCLRFSRF